ncbi:hypothetical protein Celaphus_00002462 [Cervus elaphus hippelaphus]|uniref:Uncharacterized protein n=1 Tax=Cervus elaphus hippelaphus TaxID=46360 RepID=A0A212CFG9_CEREH|nr:hypothetical protein Celaphus_00002462 [Cervus elaphus hippelaphus]
MVRNQRKTVVPHHPPWLAVLGTPHSLPHLMNPSISPAFLHLNKAHQKPGLLGEPPAMVLQTAVGIGSPLPLKTELGHLGEAHKSCPGAHLM